MLVGLDVLHADALVVQPPLCWLALVANCQAGELVVYVPVHMVGPVLSWHWVDPVLVGLGVLHADALLVQSLPCWLALDAMRQAGAVLSVF